MKPAHTRIAAVVATALSAVAAVLALSGGASSAELAAEQRTPWGLETYGTSRTIAGFDSLGWALTEAEGAVFSGGNFLDVTNGARTVRQPYLAAFDVYSGVPRESFAPEVGGPVLALETGTDGGVFVGGEMDTWNGTEVGALVKIDPATGAVWPGWNTRLYGGTSVVRNLSLEPDGWLYAVGTFTTASDAGNPTAVANVVRMDPVSGAIDWNWLPQLGNGAVWGVSASRTNGTVYFVGWFDVAGKPAIGISTDDASQVTWDGFEMNYVCCDHMYDVAATEFGTVFVVGEQHGAYVYDEHQDMALVRSHVTAYNSDHQPTTGRHGGDYQRIVRVGDRLYATCHCWGSHSTTVGPAIQPYSNDLAFSSGTHTGSVNGVLAYDAATGAHIPSFSPYMSGDVGGWDVLGASDGCVWVTGGINAVGPPGDQRPGRDLVRLCDQNHEPPAVAGPAGCLATFSGEVVTVTWDAVADAADYVVHRSVDGATPSWRGRVTAAPFTDTVRDADLVYSVSARSAAGVRSTGTTCDSTVVAVEPTQPDPPAECLAVPDPATGTITVTWDAAAGAADQVVYRSVDGGPQYWRGVAVDSPFVDSSRDGVLEYFVSSRDEQLRRSDRTACGRGDGPDPGPEPEPPAPVEACVVTLTGDGDGATVSWEASPAGDAQYVVYRTVDGGSQFWRGRVGATAFDDTLRSGTIEYFVDVKVGGERSARAACTPVVVHP